MKTRVSLFLLALALLTFSATAAPNGINIIVNGDFENFVVDNATFPPWQFQGGFDAYINMPSDVAHGRNCVFVAGQMWQDLNTEIGQAYQLSFYERGDDYGQSEQIVFSMSSGAISKSRVSLETITSWDGITMSLSSWLTAQLRGLIFNKILEVSARMATRGSMM